MKTLLVCGSFDASGGRPSKIGGFVADGMKTLFPAVRNGGSLDDLRKLADDVRSFDAVVWFAHVSNDVPTKFVSGIKKANRTCTLVVSKRNDAGRYSMAELIDRALRNRANLLVEIRKRDGRASARILDPLGNMFLSWTEDFREVGAVLAERIADLRSITRIGCQRIGDPVEIPDERDFFQLVRRSAHEFQKLIPNVVHPSRFIGNASFRCSKGGFPSFRHDDRVFVSRRNIDKQSIDRDGFVAVVAGALPVQYFGDHKPSVDAPCQLMLYELYPEVRYMLHGHVYLKERSMTEEFVPCGGIQEVLKISKIVGEQQLRPPFAVNLKGHGFIALACSVSELCDLTAGFEERPCPEMM